MEKKANALKGYCVFIITDMQATEATNKHVVNISTELIMSGKVPSKVAYDTVKGQWSGTNWTTKSLKSKSSHPNSPKVIPM